MSGAVITRTGASSSVARAPRRRWSAQRLAGAAVLGAWAFVFWFLWLTGRDALYLSSRTDWVVPVAAVLLTAATIGRLLSARVSAREHLRAREAWIMGLMVVPVILVSAAPPATLGTFSEGRRAGFAGAGYAAAAGGLAEGELTLVDVAAAQASTEGEQALAARAGETVTFVGFVVRRDDTPADELLLTRYVVSCCAADAAVAQVRIVSVTPGEFGPDDWIQVTGPMYPVGREVIVDAQEVVQVDRPDSPYLTP